MNISYIESYSVICCNTSSGLQSLFPLINMRKRSIQLNRVQPVS